MELKYINKSISDISVTDMDVIANPYDDITSIVQKWGQDSNANFGILFVGTNESFSHNNTKCVDLYDDIYLEIEVIEKNK